MRCSTTRDLPSAIARCAELAAKKAAAVPALASGVDGKISPPMMRLNAVWTLSRIDSPEAAAAARLALADADDGVRQAAATAAGLFRDREGAVRQLCKLYRSDKSPPVRREAATVAGPHRRHGSRAALCWHRSLALLIAFSIMR